MENHPIPQDVTGFKFRLIGSVTVKQFLFILVAGALCGIFFIMPISFLIKWPMIFFIASLGAGLAFFPIEGRPMDVMLLNFLKALPAENRYIFHKQGADALLHEFFMPSTQKTAEASTAPKEDARRELLLSQLIRKNAPYRADANERKQLDDIQGMFNASDVPVTGIAGLEEVSPPEPIQRQTMVVKPPVDMQPPNPPVPVVPEPAEEPAEVIEPPTPTPVQEAVQSESVEPRPGIETVKDSTPAQSVKPENQIATGFPHIPDTPNVVIGIVKDARGKVLPNIIVEVIDEDKNPLRAFKTNALGQFASATPLPQGHYQILLEDTRHVHEFSPIDIEMKNEIFQPLEIISTDQREKLRQELFGATAPGS